MAIDADFIADRRRIRRKLTFWRVLAVVLVILALGAAGTLATGSRGFGERQIARVTIDGFIAGNEQRSRLLDTLSRTERVEAVLIKIDSPGGTTSGAEELYRDLRKLSEKKPTVAVIGGLAASGGYIAALGTERIVARETALVGSIGVLFQYPNVAGLLETIGVDVEEVKSSPLKAAPNGFEPASPEARAALEALVADSYAWFKGLVSDRRGLDEAQLTIVSDGRVFTGRQSVPLRLVDELGGEQEAKAWLQAQKKISADLPVREWRPRSDDSSFSMWRAAAALAGLMGLPSLEVQLARLEQVGAATQLDGLLAVWHPALGKNTN